MDEQLLKDFLETAKQNQYNWDVIMPKFPELEGVDLQLLKDYTQTAIDYNYDYDIINPKFPEFFGEQYEVKKKDESGFKKKKTNQVLLLKIKMGNWLRKTFLRLHNHRLSKIILRELLVTY
jgi:hypothetical protein